jgi:Uma2 family endonuclease
VPKGDAMPTLLKKIGPAEHGREMTLDEFMAADYQAGYQYELIDGRLYVSPQADFPQGFVDEWIGVKLLLYSLQHPEVMNYINGKARVFVHGREKTTNPEPDRACYRDFPKHLPIDQIRWQDLNPFLVVEILSPDDPDKDLVRNVKLYWEVPSIQEYWVFDTRENPNEPTMIVYRRQAKRWKKLTIPFGGTYTSPLLPGFALIVDPRS